MQRYLRYIWRHACRLAATLRPRLPAWLAHCLRPRADYWAHFSPGMAKLPHLAAFVGSPVLRLPIFPGAELLWPRLHPGCKGVFAWGRKDKKDRAKRFAARFGLPLLRLEDGFLRSVDLGVNGAAPLSLVADDTGIYYDATQTSGLENLLNGTGWESPELLARAQKAMLEICEHNLSKYNHAPILASLPQADGRKRVLVIDQTANDLSVSLGMADASSFAAMLKAALAENPGAQIFVKTHPDVLRGKKQGFFAPETLPGEVHLLACDINPVSLLREMDVVYTVTSQMGFEALLLGKEVHCFGMPFYAGWGLTHDRQKCERRVRKRTLAEVFAAAYLEYARYVNPLTGQRCGLETAIHLLAVQRDANEANRGYHACLGFKRWKQPHASAFLRSTGGTTKFFADAQRAVSAAKAHNGRVVAWASRAPQGLEELCAGADVPLLRMEDGFLRSVGLGSNFFRPGSLVLDDRGIYYDPTRPSQLEELVARPATAEELEKARTLRRLLVERDISKYNVTGERDLPRLPVNKNIVLVPGQVEDDASVRLGGMGMDGDLALLAAVRKARPNAFIIYKEHPDVTSGNRPGRIERNLLAVFADAIVHTTPIGDILRVCDEVHTLTSLTGFEALIRDIPVWTYGGPFYAGWGLTNDRHSFPRRKTVASVEQLLVGALLRYPRYYDWNSQTFVDCLDFVNCLTAARRQPLSAKEYI